MTMFARRKTTLNMKLIVFLCLHCFELAAGQLQTRAPYFAPYTLDCKLTRAGREYAGPLNTTSSGRLCQSWNSDQPQLNYYKDANNYYPEGSAADAGNRCRNPDVNYNIGVWCYTTTPGIRWDVCDVRFCECLLPNDTLGIHYEGQISRTRSGQPCRRWSHQYPNRHPFNESAHFPDASIADAYVYCRNPNGSRPDGPWCYVNSRLDWNYCRIPICNLTSPILPTRRITTALTTIPSRVTSFRTPGKISLRETSAKITSSRDAVTESSFTIRWKTTSSVTIQSRFATESYTKTSLDQKTSAAIIRLSTKFSTESSTKTSLVPKTTSVIVSSAKFLTESTARSSLVPRATSTIVSSAKFSTESNTRSSVVQKTTSAFIPLAKFSTESSTKSSLIPNADSANISSSKVSADSSSTRSSLSPEISLVTTSATSASKTHEHLSEANGKNSLHIAKVVVPVLGVIVLIVVFAFFVSKRHRIFQKSWSRFSDWRDLLPKQLTRKREPLESVALPERGNL